MGSIKELKSKNQLNMLQHEKKIFSRFPGRITIYLNLEKEKHTFVLCAVKRTGCFYIHFMDLYIHYK